MTIDYRYIVLILSFLFTTSCEKTLELEYPEFTPNLVILSTPSPDLSWKVNVSYSKNVLESNVTRYEKNAKVYIKNIFTQSTIQLFYASEGDYVLFNEFPESGQTYELRVEVDDYEVVTARTYIPMPVDAKVTESKKVVYDGNQAIQVDFEINDNDDHDNFYIYEILSLDSKVPDSSNLLEYINSPIKRWLSTIDGNTGYLEGNSGKQSKLFVSDNNFKGAVLNTSLVSFLELDRDSRDLPELVEELPEPDLKNSKLKLSSVSQDMYKYQRTRELILLQNTINSSLSTPSETYSNINNGLGIFAGFSKQVFDL